MPLLNRESILSADDLETKDVRVKEWGGTVRVRTMTGSERDRFLSLAREAKENGHPTAYQRTLVACCAVDESGSLLFPTPDDVTSLATKNARALERVFEAAAKLNRMGVDDEEELEKNSEAAPTGSSTSP